MKITAVVMAGGSGKRFWPLSRKNRPKQFLPIPGPRTMLQQAVRRLEEFIPQADIHIITLDRLAPLVAEQLPGIPRDNILAEPLQKNTAAAVGMASTVISHKNPGAVMIVLPSDHYIADERSFARTLKAAAVIAAAGSQIVTIGIPPSAPETGYGYIHIGGLLKEVDGLPVWEALEFIEKPPSEKAAEFCASGDYFWNSGIFIWRVDLIRQLIATHMPGLEKGLREIESAPGSTRQQVVEEVYRSLPGISIDCGVLEKCRDILVIPGQFGGTTSGHGRPWRELSHIKKCGRPGMPTILLRPAAFSWTQPTAPLFPRTGLSPPWKYMT